jgi:superfamily II helicase
MALSGTQFSEHVRIEGKMRNNQTLTQEEQDYAKKHNLQGPKLCGYKGCKNQLEPRVDSERPKIGGVEVCSDCFSDAIGAEVEAHPIGRQRPRGTSFTD